MKRKKVWRYYCDYCKKAGCSGGHLAKHERGCTANPDRICGLHKHCEKNQLPVKDLIALLRSGGTDPKAGMLSLREGSDNCPACILAAIRQSGVQEIIIDEDGISTGPDLSFDFKEELAAFWNNHNDSRASYE